MQDVYQILLALKNAGGGPVISLFRNMNPDPVMRYLNGTY